MSTANDNLGRKEATLLLYLAGELSETDRADVDRRLLEDPSMREMLEELRASQDAISIGIARLDELSPLPAVEAVTRSVGRSMRQWQVDELARRPVNVPTRYSRFGWRTYTTAAVAVAAIVFFVVSWTGQPDRPIPPADGAIASTDDEDPYPVIDKESPVYEPTLALDHTFGDDEIANVEHDMAGLRLMRTEIR